MNSEISLENIVKATILPNATTNIELHNYHDDLFQSIPAKISYYVFVFITHVIGPTLMAGIISFEKWGGDSQKRNVINRLFSYALANLLVFTCLIGICRMWRDSVGVIDSKIMIWIECFGYISVTNFLLFTNQMAVLKYLYIVVWKRVKELDDGFWGFYLSTVTVCWSSFQCVIEHTPFEVRMRPFKLNVGNSTGSIVNERYINSLLSILTLIIFHL